MQVSSYQESKKHIKEHKINTLFSCQYIEALWSEKISLCKILNIICNIITCNSEPQANREIWLFSSNWFFRTVCINELVQFTSSFTWMTHSSQDHICHYFGSFRVGVTVRCLKVSFDWVDWTCRSVLLEPWTVSDVQSDLMNCFN